MGRFSRILLLVGLVLGFGAEAGWAATPSSGTLTDLTTAPFHPAGEVTTTTISVGPPPVSGIRDGQYTASTDVWSKNIHLTGSTLTSSHDGDGEPAVKMDLDGNAWVVSNSGLGLGGWKVNESCGQEFKFFDPEFPVSTAGGDGDVEVAGVKNPLGFYNIYSSSLDQLAN